MKSLVVTVSNLWLSAYIMMGNCNINDLRAEHLRTVCSEAQCLLALEKSMKTGIDALINSDSISAYESVCLFEMCGYFTKINIQ